MEFYGAVSLVIRVDTICNTEVAKDKVKLFVKQGFVKGVEVEVMRAYLVLHRELISF
jgi:hypothetical protein